MIEPKTWLIDKNLEGNIGIVAEHIKQVVKLKAKGDIEAETSGIQDVPWFVEKHLEVVEERAN